MRYSYDRHTLGIYALYAKGTLLIRYTTLSIRYSYVRRGLLSIDGVLTNSFSEFAYAF